MLMGLEPAAVSCRVGGRWHARRVSGSEPSKPWWQDHPELIALREQALRDLLGDSPREQLPDGPDPVVEEFFSGACRGELASARDGLERARAEYETAVLKARRLGWSWGEIGAVLGVSRQQLHRRFRGRG